MCVESYSRGGDEFRVRAALASGALVLAFSAAVTGQTVSFARDDYASFAGARAIVSADFNRDGWPDLALANTGRNSVTILLNHRGTGLARAADIAVGAGPFDMTAGDFNRDGIADLAVANADGNSISVLLGNGDGMFTRRDIAAPGQNPRGITAADVNDDGKPDLIYSAYATGVVQVLIGDGAGNFTNGVAYVSSALHPQGLATADFNRDGHVDVAVAYAGGAGLRILYGNGGTAFTARTVTSAANLNVLDVGDFDRDGWMDVAAASTANGTVSFYRGSATGLVRTQTSVVGSSPRGIAVADMNADGLPDVMTVNRTSSTVSVLLGDGAHPGTFLAHVEVAAGSGSRDAVVADFDGDGRLDIACANEFAASATVLSNRTFLAAGAYAFRHLAIRSTAADPLTDAVWPGDFNRDGRPDLVIRGVDGSLTMLLTGGPAISLPVPVPAVVHALAVVDVNGDGNPDVMYAASAETDVVGTFLGDGRGGFVQATTPITEPRAFAVGDLNRDGRPDLAVVGFDRAAATWVLRVGVGRGDGTFALMRPEPLPDIPVGVALADLNRDGRLDVVVLVSGFLRHQPSETRVWFGDGAGGLSATSWTTSFVTPYGVQFAIADVNHDGYIDIVASEFQQMAVAFGSATGFSAPVYTSVTDDDRFLGPVSIGDLNVDGHPDVALGSGDVLFGNGDGTFISGGRFDYGDAFSVCIVDFTRDGLPDIIAVSNGRGVVVLANTRDHDNHPPAVDVGPDRTMPFSATQGDNCEGVGVTATASDPDAHAVTYEWSVNGVRESNVGLPDPATRSFCGLLPGSYVYSVTVRDGRGGAATDSLSVTVESSKEIVLWAADASTDGRWTLVDDQTAAGGVRAYDPNLGAPKITAPLVQPASLVSLRFFADPRLTYKLWIRLKADGNSWANDSVWVQFSGATDLAGTPKYRIGTNSGLSVSLEECSGCGVSQWGWEDDGWGALNKNGVLLRFAESPDRDPQSMIIQTREDGVSIDQIVLSAEKYLTTRPGAAKNDATILSSTQPRR